MVRKLKFPLVMEDGENVRTLDELKEHFSISKVMEYHANGKLTTWLRNCYWTELADKVDAISIDDENAVRKICELFEIEYDESISSYAQTATERQKRAAKLKEYSSEQKYYSVIDDIAFDQDELYDRLDEEKTVIYLCGDKFSIPLDKHSVKYIGINEPIVIISSKQPIDFSDKGIVFEDVKFDDKYTEILEKAKEKASAEAAEAAKRPTLGEYKSDSPINNLLNVQQKESAKEMYEMISRELYDLEFDIDADTKEMRQMILDSGIIGAGEEFVKTM